MRFSIKLLFFFTFLSTFLLNSIAPQAETRIVHIAPSYPYAVPLNAPYVQIQMTPYGFNAYGGASFSYPARPCPGFWGNSFTPPYVVSPPYPRGGYYGPRYIAPPVVYPGNSVYYIP